ncbi:hypothetical protein [Parasitella parasitica]|uniref:Mitotic-spindle organizing protein 1 n=1 Tax=Parasitella parasitica TaxID=35722 RepID=A0A0B7NR13_9FUNG|nr:hypothetical protein [Parasitella parasitica]
MAQKIGRKRFPDTALGVANLVRVAKTVGISRQAIDEDVEYLLYSFKSVCQNDSDIYHDLFEFYIQCMDTDTNVEAALIFDKLKNMKAFLFVQEQEPDSHFTEEKIEFKKAIEMNQKLNEFKKRKIDYDPVCRNLNILMLTVALTRIKFVICSDEKLYDYTQLAQEYQNAKRSTFYTPQAACAMKKTLKETVNVVETRPRYLRNFLLNSTLGHDETHIVDQVKQTGQQMLNSKRRKLSVRDSFKNIARNNKPIMEPSRDADVKETIDILSEMANILNTGLDRETVSLCVSLCERGVNPEALATVIKELRELESNNASAATTTTSTSSRH